MSKHFKGSVVDCTIVGVNPPYPKVGVRHRGRWGEQKVTSPDVAVRLGACIAEVGSARPILRPYRLPVRVQAVDDLISCEVEVRLDGGGALVVVVVVVLVVVMVCTVLFWE